MLYVKDAKGTVDEVVARLQQAAAANKFGVLQIIDLKEKMAAKGVEFGPECRILEVCNPQQAKKVLEDDMRVSTALPCRISVYEAEGQVKVATIKPTIMMAAFGASGLQAVAREVEDTIIRIIDAACA
jgi:uncharacterized protein (DUF302 family)